MQGLQVVPQLDLRLVVLRAADGIREEARPREEPDAPVHGLPRPRPATKPVRGHETPAGRAPRDGVEEARRESQ